MVRCKFRVDSYETRLDSNKPDATEIRRVNLAIVYEGSEENEQYFRWTPSGRIEIGLLNPEAWKQLPLGAEVYVDIYQSSDTHPRPMKKE